MFDYDERGGSMPKWKEKQKRRPGARYYVGRPVKGMGDFELECYMRGWNSALKSAESILRDFMELKEDDLPWAGSGTTGRTTTRGDG